MESIDPDFNYFRWNLYNGINLACVDCAVETPQDVKSKGTIVLIHGFPETSYQFRNVIPAFANAGYRVLAPDYRGAGESSKPMNGFTKAVMAADIVQLLDHLGIEEPVHIVGHDIGGMIAFVIASRWPDRVLSVCFSECLLPGTNTYSDQRAQKPIDYFHFIFHCVANLPEALIQGRERTYIEYFINKMCYRVGAFTPENIQRYTNCYSQPGALRCALALYRALDKDEEDNIEWIKKNGKCKVPCMVLSGEHSGYREHAARMALEVVERPYLTSSIVKSAGHFLSEENPQGFADIILAFMKREEKR